MKRTITLRVEVKNDEHYADVVAAVVNRPEVITWAMTRGEAGRKPNRARDWLLRKHGIASSGFSTSAAEYVDP